MGAVVSVFSHFLGFRENALRTAGVEPIPVGSAVVGATATADSALLVWLSTITGVLGILLILNVAYIVRRLRRSKTKMVIGFKDL